MKIAAHKVVVALRTLARPLEMCCSPQAIAVQGRRALATAMNVNGASRLFQLPPMSGRPIAPMITASVIAPEPDRMSTSTVGLMSCTPSLMKRKEAPQIRPSAANARYGSSRLRPSDTGRPIVGREHERHGPVVFDAHSHDCSKAPGFRLYSAFTKSLDECEIQLLGTVWIPCLQQAWPPAAAQIREQRELGHDQRRSFHGLEAKVHPARLVREHAHVHDLVRKPAHRGFIVIRPRTDQQHEARPDGCSLLRTGLFPGHRPGSDPLSDQP